MTVAQPDLFDIAPARSPPAPAPLSEPVHWLVVGTKLARTACGIVAREIFRAARAAISIEEQRFSCTLDRFDGTVTCERCLEVIS